MGVKYRRVLLSAVMLLLLVSCAAMEERQEKNRRIADTHVQLAIGYIKQGQYEWALEKLKKALDVTPDNATAHSTIALVYENLGENDLADDHYQRAISLSHKDGAKNNYGVFLCKLGRLKQADSYFQQAIETPRYPTPELAYENAGTCALKVPDLNKAESYLRAALERNPNLPVSLYNMAEISYAQQQYLSSRAYLQRFEAVAEHTAKSLWLGIQIERKLGDQTAEAGYAKQLQSKFPSSVEFKKLMSSSRIEGES